MTRKAKKRNVTEVEPRSWDCTIKTLTSKSKLVHGKHMGKPFLATYFKPTAKSAGAAIMPANRKEALRLKKEVDKLVKLFPKD